MNDEPREYHLMVSCNACGNTNSYEIIDTTDGHISEARTWCNVCDFEDYWAFGYFQSGSYKPSYCDKVIK